MTDSATALTALFQTISRATQWKTPSLKRFPLPIPISSQPTFSLSCEYKDYAERATASPQTTILRCECWVFCSAATQKQTEPSPIYGYVTAVENALAPGIAAPFRSVGVAQTLGIAIHDCRIEGKITIWPGDTDGQGAAMIPIKIILPA